MPIWGWVLVGVGGLWALLFVVAVIGERKQRRHYEQHGDKVVGWVVQANPDLYSWGGIDKPAQILVAFDGNDPNDPFMSALAARVVALKGLTPPDPVEVEVAKLVNDETYRPFERFRLPDEFTGGREVYTMHVWVKRSKLPGNILSHPFVRCLVLRDDAKSRPLMIEYQSEDTGSKPKPPRREPAPVKPVKPRDPDEPGGALKPLLITFGCIAVAFAGIMAFVLLTAPKAGDAAVAPGDPTPPAVKPNVPQPSVTPPKPVGPVVPPITPPDIAATQLAVLPAPPNTVREFQYSDKHDLLFYSDPDSITVLDAKAGSPLPLPKVEGKRWLRSVGVAPDQTAAFASDGQTLHRLDLATRKWESRPFTGTRVLALDGTTVLVQLVQVKALAPVTWAVVRWDAGEAKAVRKMAWVGLYELVYDPVAKVLFAHHSKTLSATPVLERYARVGDEFKSEGSKTHTDSASMLAFSSLTADGKYYIRHAIAVPTDLKTGMSVRFNEEASGLVDGWAVGSSGKLFSVETGKLAGKLATPAYAVAAASDGRTVWVQSLNPSKFVKYRIDAEKK